MQWHRVYRGVIDELLEEPAGVKLTAHARRQGDHINIEAEVGDLAAPGSNKKLRLLLTEETVRYVGSKGTKLLRGTNIN